MRCWTGIRQQLEQKQVQEASYLLSLILPRVNLIQTEHDATGNRIWIVAFHIG